MSGKVYRYADLVGKHTKYAQKMRQLHNHIWGESNRPVTTRTLKVIKEYSAIPHEKNPHVIKRYPRYVETEKLMKKLREYGLFRDEHQDFIDEMTRQRALRGKPPYVAPYICKEGKFPRKVE